MEALTREPEPPKPPEKKPENASKKVYKTFNRSIVFPAKRLESKEDIESYVEKMKQSLEQLLQNCDGIDLT